MMTNINTILKTIVLLLSLGMFLAAAHLAEARTAEKVEVPVLNESVRIGTIITEDMLTTKLMPQHGLRHVLRDKGLIVGKEAKRNMREGLAIRESHLMQPLDIRRGEIVMLKYQRPGIALATEGRSLMAGRKGDWIYVVNLASNKRVQAFIEHDGTVSVR